LSPVEARLNEFGAIEPAVNNRMGVADQFTTKTTE